MDRHYEAIECAFPELATIENSELRTNVCEAWAIAMTDNDIDDLETVAWFPPVQRDLDLPDGRPGHELALWARYLLRIDMGTVRRLIFSHPQPSVIEQRY